MRDKLSLVKEYICKRGLIIPLAGALIFLLLEHVFFGKALPRRFPYMNLFFYSFIIVCLARQLKGHSFFGKLKDAKRFFAFAYLAACTLHLSYMASSYLKYFTFTRWSDNGTIDAVYTETYLAFTLYSVSAFLIVPIGEELLFRYVMISFSSRRATALTVLFSFLLYVAMNANHWIGLLTLALPFFVYVASYLLTKNIYVTIFIHILYSLAFYGPQFGYAFARMMYR